MSETAPRAWRRVAPGAHTKEITETLPPEVRQVIDKMVADLRAMEARLAQAESFQSALIREATSKLKDVA